MGAKFLWEEKIYIEGRPFNHSSDIIIKKGEDEADLGKTSLYLKGTADNKNHFRNNCFQI